MPATATASSATQATAPTRSVRPPRRACGRPGPRRGRPGPGCCPRPRGGPACLAGPPDGGAAGPASSGTIAGTTGIGSVRCSSTSAGSHLASRCHSSPASRHALIDCCHTDRPPAPAGARDVAGPRARAPRIRCQLPARGSVPVPEPPRVPGPPSATGIVVGADAGPGSGWSPPAVRLSQPGPAASIPPGCPRRAGVRPRAGMTPRSVHGETVRLAPPVEPAFLLTDRPMRWSGMNKACASRQGTRFVSRPTMVVHLPAITWVNCCSAPRRVASDSVASARRARGGGPVPGHAGAARTECTGALPVTTTRAPWCRSARSASTPRSAGAAIWRRPARCTGSRSPRR